MRYSRFKSEFLVYALLWVLLKPLAVIAAVELVLETLDLQARRLVAEISESRIMLLLLVLLGWFGVVTGIGSIISLSSPWE